MKFDFELVLDSRDIGGEEGDEGFVIGLGVVVLGV